MKRTTAVIDSCREERRIKMRSPLAFISNHDPAHEQEWLAALSAAMPEETILPFRAIGEAARQAVEVAIVANPDPADVVQFESLCWIHSVWAGVERLVGELKPFLARGNVPVVRMVDPEMSRTMAEAVLAWCYYLQRDMPLYRRQQMQKIWQPQRYRPPSDIVVGFVGLGVLAQAAAQKLHAAGFGLAGWSRTEKRIDGIETFTGETGLQHMLGKSDIIVLLLPLTDETQALMNKMRFTWLKKGAGLINFARGAIVESQALLEALANGVVSHAVLDVFINEPLSPSCPYWYHPGITVLPHISAPSPLVSSAAVVARNVAHWRRSGEIPDAIDPVRGY